MLTTEELGDENEDNKTISWRVTYDSSIFNPSEKSSSGLFFPKTIIKPHDDTDPMKIMVNHSFKAATAEDIRRVEEAMRKRVPMYEKKVLRILGRERKQPFMTTEEICNSLHVDEFSFEIYAVCEELEKKGKLKSRKFYDEQGHTRVWWLTTTKV